MTPDQYRKTREKKGYTQGGLAALLGLPREAIVRREGGTQRITQEAVIALHALPTAPEGSTIKSAAEAVAPITDALKPGRKRRPRNHSLSTPDRDNQSAK
jgi:DNA-binding XRE family transcriptional regulator